MTIAKWLIEEDGTEFVAFEGELLLENILLELEALALTLDKTHQDPFIVIVLSGTSVAVARLSRFIQSITAGSDATRTLADYADQPPFEPADEVYSMDTPEDNNAIHDELLDTPNGVYVIRDGLAVKAVLHNPSAGGASGTASGSFAALLKNVPSALQRLLPIWNQREQRSDVYFTPYLPSEVSPDLLRDLSIFAHTLDALPEVRGAEDVENVNRRVPLSEGNTTGTPVSLLHGAELTIKPMSTPNVHFEPPLVKMIWDGHKVEAKFRFIVNRQQPGPLLLPFTVYLNGMVPIATLEASLIVKENAPLDQSIYSPSKKMAQKVFISYSRKDADVAKQFYNAMRFIGNEVFLDTESIPSGALWETTLAEAISLTDIFMLFWSANSAASEQVNREWNYCLSELCNGKACSDVVRIAMIGENPPPLPKALGILNAVT